MTEHVVVAAGFVFRKKILSLLFLSGHQIAVASQDRFRRRAFVTVFRIGFAGVLKLVDKPDLGSGAVRRMGSTPFTRTTRVLILK